MLQYSFGGYQFLFYGSSFLQLERRIKRIFEGFHTSSNNPYVGKYHIIILEKISRNQYQLHGEEDGLETVLPDKLHHELAVTLRRLNQVSALGMVSVHPQLHVVFNWPLQKGVVDADKIDGYGKAIDLYSVFVVNTEHDSLEVNIWSHIIQLLAQGATKQKGILLHSAAIARSNDGFLFLGGSGAGKTTLASMSTGIDHAVLGDEFNLVRKSDDRFLIEAIPSMKPLPVGYSLSKPALCSIFYLVQDSQDKLIPIPPAEASTLLYDTFHEQTPFTYRFTDAALEKARQLCIQITNDYPVYELHFRKNLDFWKLIDQQFPA